MTKATPQVVVKDGPEENPIVTMITPGRRAIGETWSKVSIAWQDGQYVLNREDSPAPADGRPIVVPSLGNASPEMVNFILQQQMKEAEYRESSQSLTREQRRQEAWQRVNEMWQEYMEQKLKWLKGQSTIGPAGLNQREKA